MAIEPKNFDHLIGKVQGLSEKQLKAHFGLYQGYVKKLNEITEKLNKTDKGAPNYSFNEYSELKRREPVAFNGTILHEAYFGILGKAGEPAPALKKAIEKGFGSMDAWVADMRACLMSSHGWALTVFDWNYMQLRTNLVHGEHHQGLFPNASVIVAIDAWEHAYMIDYGTTKADYVSNVLNALDWDAINARWTGMVGAHADKIVG